MNDATEIMIPAEATITPDLKRGEPLIDLSDAEQQRRALAMATTLDRVAAIQGGPDIDDGAFFRALDESHPDRPHHARYY